MQNLVTVNTFSATIVRNNRRIESLAVPIGDNSSS